VKFLLIQRYWKTSFKQTPPNKNKMSAYLDACEDRGERYTGHEHEEEASVQLHVPLRVEDREQDEAGASDHGAKHSQCVEDFFSAAHCRN
jgi:hypothetical protein